MARPAGHVFAAPVGGLPDSYIVVLRSGSAAVPVVASGLTKRYGGVADELYTSALRGFSVKMNAEQAGRMASDPVVVRVEQNRDLVVTPRPSEPGMRAATWTNASSLWGLDRIDQRVPSSNDNRFRYQDQPRMSGAGVTTYVLSTGVDYDHPQFQGRAGQGRSFVDAPSHPRIGDTIDCGGLGTKLAGVVGSQTYGVAKNVSIVGLRVTQCYWSEITICVARGVCHSDRNLDRLNTSVNDVIEAVDWVTQNAARPAVGLLGFAGPGGVVALETALQNSVAAGVTWVVPAGNYPHRSCQNTPSWLGGNVHGLISVGATNELDRVVAGTSYDECVDIFAPGDGIQSVVFPEDSGFRDEDDMNEDFPGGTEFSAAFTAGVVAQHLEPTPNATPAQVEDSVLLDSTLGKINPGGGAPDRLLHGAWWGPATFLLCESMLGNQPGESWLSCSAASLNGQPSSLRWEKNTSQAQHNPVPAWNDQDTVEGRCTPGVWYNVEVTATVNSLSETREVSVRCISGNNN
jgi:hypothetical protein